LKDEYVEKLNSATGPHRIPHLKLKEAKVALLRNTDEGQPKSEILEWGVE